MTLLGEASILDPIGAASFAALRVRFKVHEVSRYTAPDTDVIACAVPAPSAAPLLLRAVVVDGPDRGMTVPLDEGPVTIGTSPRVNMMLSDKTVSRVHARLVPHPDGVEIVDLGSKNGVFVAGSRLIHAKVAPGTEFQVGQTTLQIAAADIESFVEPSARSAFVDIRGKGLPMRRMFATLERVAAQDCTVLIEGEPGVGKLRVARALHAAGPARDKKMIVVDALDVGTHVFEQIAAGDVGTLVIAHVDQLTDEAKRLLYRELEQGNVGARILATTRKDLDTVFGRTAIDRSLRLLLGVVRVRVPALRERGSDLPLLVNDLLAELDRPDHQLSPSDFGKMQAYAWPDNVRELRAALERRVSLDGDGSFAVPVRLPKEGEATESIVGANLPYKQARAQMIEAFEREYSRSLLEQSNGNVSRAARVAGIDRVYLHRLIRKYAL